MKRIVLGMILLGIMVFGVAADTGAEGCNLPTSVSDGGFAVEGIPLSLQSQALIFGGKRHQDDFGGDLYGSGTRIENKSRDNIPTRSQMKESLHRGVDDAFDLPKNIKEAAIELGRQIIHRAIDKLYRD